MINLIRPQHQSSRILLVLLIMLFFW